MREKGIMHSERELEIASVGYSLHYKLRVACRLLSPVPPRTRARKTSPYWLREK